MKQRTPTKNDTALLIRLPANLKAQLESRAEGEHRSASAHIRWLIEQDLKAAA